MAKKNILSGAGDSLRNNANRIQPSGGGGGGRVPSGVSSEFSNTYRQLINESGRGANGGTRPTGILKADEDMRRGYKRGNAVDQFFAGMGRVGEEIQGWSGQEEAAKTDNKVDDALSFLGGLVTGTVSAPFTGASQIYEGVTGRRATEMTDDGLIPEEDLGWGQRAATTASGAINVIGPMFGGSGEMLKGGKNAIQYGIGRMAANDGKAWGTKMMVNAVKSATREGGESFALKTAKDMAEEAAEEFIQSPLDEVREGTIDGDWLTRAGNAAAMGALGGGIMSAAGQGINYGLSKLNPPSDKAGTRKTIDVPTPPGVLEQRSTSSYGFDPSKADTMLPDARDAYDQEIKDRQTSPGSAPVLQVSGNSTHSLNSASIGAKVFRDIFYNPDRGRSAKMVADWFGVELDEMSKIMASSDYDQRLHDIHEANKRANKTNVLHLGRNPATEKVGRFDMDVDEILTGDKAYIDMHPLAYNFVRADVDGDMINVFLDPSVTTEGYITRRIQNKVRNSWNEKTQSYDLESNLEFEDFSYIARNLDDAALRELFGEAVSTLENVDQQTSDDLVDRWVSLYNRLLRGRPTNTDGRMARFFATVRSDVSRLVRDESNQVSGSPDRVTGDLIGVMSKDPRSLIQHAIETSTNELVRHFDAFRIQVRELEGSTDPNASGYMSRGALPTGMESIVSIMYRLTNVVAKFSESQKNPMFRSDGQFVMNAQAQSLIDVADELYTMMAKEIGGESRNDVFDKLFAIAIKQVEAGSDIIDNISGAFDGLVRAKTVLDVLGKTNGRLSTGEDLRLFMEKFRDNWNELVVPYEKAMKSATTRFPQEAPNISHKKRIEGGDPLENIELARAIVESFEDINMDSWIDTTDAPGIRNMTIGQWLDAYIVGGRSDRTQFGGYDPEFQKFMSLAIASRMARAAGTNMSIVDLVGDVSRQLRNLYANGTLDPRDRAMAEHLVTSLRKLFDPQVANAIGLVSVDNLLTGEWGRALASGNPFDAANAILSMALSGKYDGVYRMLHRTLELIADGDEVAAENMRLRAMSELGMVMHMSTLDRIIGSEIYQVARDLDSMKGATTFSKTFDALTSMDMGYETKVEAFTADHDLMAINVLVDALNTDTNMLGASGISGKRKLAESQYQMAMKMSYRNNATTWAGIRDYVNAVGDSQRGNFAHAIVDLLSDVYNENTVDVLAANIYTATTIANSLKEKGLTPYGAQMEYQQAEINMNGAVYSFIDKTMGLASGQISMEDLQSNPMKLLQIITNKDASIRVVDQNTQKDCVLTRKMILDELSGGHADSYDLDFNNLDKIFTAFPQLLSLIPPSVLTPSIESAGGSPTISQQSKEPTLNAIINRVDQFSSLDTRSGERRYKEGNKFEHDINKKIVSGYIMCDNEFPAAIVYRSGGFKDGASLSAIREKITEVTDKMTEAILDMATDARGLDGVNARIAEMDATNRNHLLNDIRDILTNSSALLSLMDAGRNIATAVCSDLDKSYYNMLIKRFICAQIDQMPNLNKKKRNKAKNRINGGDINVPGTSGVSSESVDVKSAVDLLLEIRFMISLGIPEATDMMATMRQTMSAEIVDNVNNVIDSTELNDRQKQALKESISSPQAFENFFMSSYEFYKNMSGVTGLVTYSDFQMSEETKKKLADIERTGDSKEYQEAFREETWALANAIYEKILEIDRTQRFDETRRRLSRSEDRDALRQHVFRTVLDLNRGNTSDGGRSAMAARNDLMQLWNSFYIKGRLERIGWKTKVYYNTNMVNAYTNDMRAIKRMVIGAREELRSQGKAVDLGDANVDGEPPTMPVADYADPIIGFMASRCTVNTTRGPAAMTVGVNGAETARLSPLGLISRHIHSDVAPVEMSYDDIVSKVCADNGIRDTKKYFTANNDNPADLVGWNRFIGAHYIERGQFVPSSEYDEKNPQYVTKRVTSEVLDDLKNNPEKKILVFDPVMSPNGIDQESTYDTYNGSANSIRILSEIGALEDTSQEGLALQTSKSTQQAHRIADRVEEDPLVSNPSAVDPSRSSSREELRGKLVEAMSRYRMAYKTYLMQVFGDQRYKVLGMDHMQAFDIAVLLTPYYEVLMSDGSRAVISTYDVFAGDGSAFAKRMDALEQDGLVAVAITPMSVNPKTIASRIGLRVNDLVIRHGGMPPTEDVGNAAAEAVRSWDDYGAGQLTATEILSGAGTRSLSTTPYVIGDDNPTPYNKFMNEVLGTDDATPGLVFSADTSARRPVDPNSDSNTSHLVNSVNKELSDLGVTAGTITIASGSPIKPPVVVQAFGTQDVLESTPSTDAARRGFIGKLAPLDDPGHHNRNVARQDGRSVGVVVSERALPEAIRWAIAYRQKLMVSYDVMSKEASGMLASVEADPTPIVYGSEPRTYSTFFVFDPSKSKEITRAMSMMASGASYKLDHNHIMLSVFDPTIPLPDAATWANLDTVSGLGIDTSPSSSSRERDLFGARGVEAMRLCSADGIAELKRLVDAGDVTLSDVLVVSEIDDRQASREGVIDSVRRFLNDMSGDGTSFRRTAGRGDTVAMAESRDASGRRIYAPIIVEHNQPTYIENINVVDTGLGGISWSGTSRAQFTADDPMKVKAYGAVYKSVAMGVPSTSMPIVNVMVDDKQLRADFVSNWKTYQGRVDDFNMFTFMDNLWYSYLRFGGSAFWREANGTRELNPKLSKLTDAQVNGLMNNDRAMWLAVETGELKLSDDERLNDIVRVVVENCRLANIPPAYIFSSIVSSDGGKSFSLRDVDVTYRLVLSGMDRMDLLRFFHFLNPWLCPDVDSDNKVKPASPGSTLLNEYGQIGVIVRDQVGDLGLMWMDCVFGPGLSLGHSTQQTRQGSSARSSMQAKNRGGLETPLTGRESREIIASMAARMGNKQAYDVIESERIGRADSRIESGEDVVGFTPVSDEDIDAIVGSYAIPGYTPWTSYKEILHQREMLDTARSFMSPPPIIGLDRQPIHDYRSPVRQNDSHAAEKNRIHSAKSRLERALNGRRGNIELDWDHFIWAVMYQTGTCMNGGNGEYRLTFNDIERAVDMMCRSLERGTGLLIASDPNAVSLDDRYQIPMLAPDVARYFIRFEAIGSKWGVDEKGTPTAEAVQAFTNAMLDESVTAKGKIEQIAANGKSGHSSVRARLKRDALLKFLDWAMHENGLPEMSQHIYGDEYVSDLICNYNEFWDYIFGTPELAEARRVMKEESARTHQHIADLAKLRLAEVNSYGEGAGYTVGMRANELKTLNNVLDYLTRVSQLLAVASPSVMGSNILDKGIHTNLTNLALMVGRNIGVGPYNTDVAVDQDAVRMAAQNPFLQKVFVGYRMAMIDGDVYDFVNACTDEQRLDEWMDAKRARGNAFTRFSDSVFNLMNGGNIFMGTQLRNFINYFLIIERDAGHDWWFQKFDATGKTLIEAQLTGHNPQDFLLDVLTGRNDNASFGNGQVAMNFALQGDMAQRNVVSMIYSEMVRRHGSCVKFLTSTLVSRFFQYRTNQMGRTLQTVLPMSSINYWFTKFVAENTEIGQAIHVEDAQVFADFKRAAQNDVAHMAPVWVGMVLASLAGLIQPPPDEEKWGNPEEWLILGHRVTLDWELEDILGLSLPIGAFLKSCMLGNPRIDILVNGIGQACYNNPLAKASDIVAMLGDEEGSLVSDYESDVERYADARGGSPSWVEWLQGKGTAAALTYVGQFITPGFVKEFVDSPMEHSYNTIWEESETGAVTEAGLVGEVMKTSFQDAQIRRVTRSNPVLGWILDWVTHPNTSYTEEGMPLTKYYDPYVMEQVRQYSILDENGNELPYEVQEARIAEIIAILESNDDMEALYQSGFYLDYATWDAVGDTIWDTIVQLDDDYYQLKEDGGLNWEVLGEGDTYGLGQQRAQEITNAYYDERAYWESLYYDKLMSEPMRRQWPVYNRYKTTYATDSNGETYATGYRANTGFLASLSPVKVAPGTMTEPDGTMGYEGDWETESVAAPGQTTGERALVPVEQGHWDYADLESHAASGDGTGYSKRRNGADAESAADDSDDDGDDYTPGGGYRYRSYGRGGGGGGGGGGGYSPNIYSRLPNSYMPTARTMYSERVYDPSYDYLRPNFETKGSREAYKRSDI